MVKNEIDGEKIEQEIEKKELLDESTREYLTIIFGLISVTCFIIAFGVLSGEAISVNITGNLIGSAREANLYAGVVIFGLLLVWAVILLNWFSKEREKSFSKDSIKISSLLESTVDVFKN